MDYHLDSRAHDSDYFTPSPDKDNTSNKIIEPRIMNMSSYQVLETSSSSRSTLSSCSNSSSPILNKPNGKQINNNNNSNTNKQPQIAIQNVNKSQNIGAADTDRPPHSYIALISMAILSKVDRKILLNEIYDWVIQHFPYYQSRTDKSWRNSIRHNLSLNECFVKVGKAGNGRGYYWSIHSANLNDFKKGDFRRRQARLRAKHDKNHQSPNTKSPKEPKEKTPSTQSNTNNQNFQNNFYPPTTSSTSSYSNQEFSNFYAQNSYPPCAYSNSVNYDTNEYFYNFNKEQNLNESSYPSPNISSSSNSSSKESPSSNGLLTTATLNQTPLTPLTPITTNNKSSPSSSTSSSLSSSPLSSTNNSSSSSSFLYTQNYNQFNSNTWFQQPIIDHFQSTNNYTYATNGAPVYTNQQYQNMYSYNQQINPTNSSILMPLSSSNENPETESQIENNLIYCTSHQQQQQTGDYSHHHHHQYSNRSNFNFL
ncbi:unnamed protein product [Brachionus calyciflorus]|uniref:Fork-head domain-containing protein n=1 Tax=Brachionus calyciflorus TaxID=104777 RepID=A0A813M7M6_9BILA|nr:unnamed protein product [Brachionus calyciflorus]